MKNNTIHILYVKQNEKLPDDIFRLFLLQLSKSFQEEINAYKHWESAQASLLGKIMLKYGLEMLNSKYTLHDIMIGEKDRPFLPDQTDLNISHSGDYIVCAISQSSRVGIDIEKHRKIDVSLFRKYFDENEWNEIQQANNSLQVFFDMWSLKESAIKCDGRGVEILSKTHKQTENQILCDAMVYYCQQIAIAEKYSCCVCSNQKFTLNTTQLSLSDLLNE